MISKSFNRIIVISLLSLSSLLFLKPIVTEASTYTNNISIEGNADSLVTIPDEEWFLKKENMLPGDSAIGTIKLDNKYDYAYEVFLRAEDTEKKSYSELVDQLLLKINLEGSNIYSGALNGEDKMTKDISLGVIKPGESKTLDASVVLDGDATGNVFKNKYASIEWIFTAVRVEEPEAPTKTGDSNKELLIFTSVLLMSAGVVIITLKKRSGNIGTK